MFISHRIELSPVFLGYVDFDGVGGAGLEGYYQTELAGEAASAVVSISPLTRQESVIAREGVDLVLTIDRTVQHIVENPYLNGETLRLDGALRMS